MSLPTGAPPDFDSITDRVGLCGEPRSAVLGGDLTAVCRCRERAGGSGEIHGPGDVPAAERQPRGPINNGCLGAAARPSLLS